MKWNLEEGENVTDNDMYFDAAMYQSTLLYNPVLLR
jgi:hypothetical protein